MLCATPRSQIDSLAVEHAGALHQYYTANATHLAPWEPLRDADYHSRNRWQERVVAFVEEQKGGGALRLLAFEPGTEKVCGVCFFTNIVQGPFQACNLGYSIANQYSGSGLMTEIVAACIKHLFETTDLHRVMANHLPENVASSRVLAKLGFEQEGYAKSYLQINGEWRDHVLTALVNPNHLTNTA